MKEHRTLWKPFLSKEKLLLITIVMILIIISTVMSFQQSIFAQVGYQEAYPNAGLEFFYNLYRIGINPFLFILLMLLLPNLMAYDVLNMYQNHADYMVECRLSKRQYYREVFVKNMIFTFVIVTMMQIIMAVIVHCCLAPIHFQSMNYPSGYMTPTQVLFAHEAVNFIAFILLTSLGYCVISGLLFSFQALITNKYVYRCFGVIFGILLVVVPALIQGYLPMPDLAFLFQINNLVAIGMENVRDNPFGLSHMMLYLTSFTLYTCIMLFCFAAFVQWRENHD